MNYWLLKCEPDDDYSYSDLEKDGKTVWDGVSNNWALTFIRKVKKGDKAFIYHTGNQRCVAGIANVVSDPYPDPNENNEKLAVFDITPNHSLKKPVTLKQIKEDSRFNEFHLVKFSRLSVMPVEKEYWDMIKVLGN
ncbi:MAG TPA: EVE domain-containing protein [Candidatus Marinimicrobia bacterium]|jgi:predicted RNA-binding protein with PUA-like domain|nr:EVE domain-containing protein [Candidatus Neomarinimicrobiota bacterium]